MSIKLAQITKSVSLVQLAPRIYALEAEESIDVGKFFIRFQECYESPKFRNKIFQIPEFIDWYKSYTGKEKFTYFQDWEGFNVPSKIIRFVAHKFPTRTYEEILLINTLKDLKINGKFYLLGYSTKDTLVKKHELAHALFYLSPSYRAQVKESLKPLNIKRHPLMDYLRTQCYHPSVLQDEFHAWVLSEEEYLQEIKLWSPDLEALRDSLNFLFLHYIYPFYEEPQKTA